MSDVRITIKPKGLIALTCLVASVLVGIVYVGGHLPKAQDKPGDVKNSVGAAAPPAANAPADNTDGIVGPELEEKKLMAELNTRPGQAHDWLFVGPIPAGTEIHEKSNNDSDQAKMDRIMADNYLPGEQKYRARENARVTVDGKTFTWKKIHGSAFDFKKIFASPETPLASLENKVVYGYSTIDSPKNETRSYRFRSDDGAVIWVNGKQVYKSTKIRGLMEEDTIDIPLRAGKNSVLIKVGQGSGGWGMMLQTTENA